MSGRTSALTPGCATPGPTARRRTARRSASSRPCRTSGRMGPPLRAPTPNACTRSPRAGSIATMLAVPHGGIGGICPRLTPVNNLRAWATTPRRRRCASVGARRRRARGTSRSSRASRAMFEMCPYFTASRADARAARRSRRSCRPDRAGALNSIAPCWSRAGRQDRRGADGPPATPIALRRAIVRARSAPCRFPWRRANRASRP